MDIESEYDRDLLRHEYFWVDHQPFLLSRGYQLRPRYAPNWIPSWRRPDSEERNQYHCPDSIYSKYPNVLDAVRTEDDYKVVLKKVRTKTDEIPVARYLSSNELRADSRNRTMPLLDILPIPADDEHCLIVMPLLREFWTPPFKNRGEVIEALRQFLQGIKFMHEHRIVHGDACWLNLMMDSTKLIPNGFHPRCPISEDGIKYRLKWNSRTSVAPMNYYIIDFGLSMWFRDPTADTRSGNTYGQDKTVPEFQDPEPHDTFRVDIYQFGNVINELLEIYDGRLEMFRDLASKMTAKDPQQRPTASQALDIFESIVSSMSCLQRRVRIRRPIDTFSRRYFRWRLGIPNL